jgi:hypothetical protein
VSPIRCSVPASPATVFRSTSRTSLPPWSITATARLTYTNEAGNSVTFFDGEHYSVDVIGELAGNTTIPNVVVGTETPYGAANPLTVTIVNPSAVLDMSVHTSGTGEEVLLVGAQTAANSQYVSIGCLYSLDGAAAIPPQTGFGQYANPLRNAEQRTASGHTAPPVFVAVVPPGAAWFIRLTARRYILSAALNAGSVVSQGQKIAISGSTTV